ncbi:MAG: type IV secretion system DNA-binding domain-containing protein [Gemmatimonadaceae bacterium]
MRDQAERSVPQQRSGDLSAFQVLTNERQSPPIAFGSALMRSLSSISRHLSFELVALSDRIVPQFVCDADDRPVVRGSLRVHSQDTKILERPDLLREEIEKRDGFGVIQHFGLRNRIFWPLRTESRLDPDPLTDLVASLDDLSPEELAVVQVLFAPARMPWKTDLLEFVEGIEDVDHVLPLVRLKFAEPTFATVVRVAVIAQNERLAVARASRVANALVTTTRSEGNELVPIDSSKVATEDWVHDLLERQTHHHGMLLSLPELLTLVHIPGGIRSERLVRQGARTKAAPARTRAGALLLGTNEHDGETNPVHLSIEERMRHTYVIGASGTGKSTLLLQMALQDLAAGHGLAVLDPHGDLIDDLLARMPENRIADVVLFDPTDEAYPVGFNILNAHSELERTLLSSDLVSVFRRLSTSFGDQMAAVLGNAVLAFLEHPEGGTLIDLRRFLIDKSFRARFLEGVQDEQVVSYWQEEYPLLKGLPHAPLLTRLNTFLRPKLIRHMVAQKDDRLDMRAIMDGRKILLARLAQGGIGEENAHLLGSLLVARIAQAAMSRQETAAANRTPFFTYIDEFHHFVTPSIAAILSGARKYGLGLTLAHQEMRQLKVRSEEVASAVLSNAATRIAFRVGEQDAKTLGEGLSFFESRDIQNLGIGEAIVRLERPDQDFNLRTPPVKPIDHTAADGRRSAVRDVSRNRYGQPKSEVEAVLRSTQTQTTLEERVAPRATRGGRRESPQGSPAPIQSVGAADRLPGRGGPQHKYLQSLVRKLAEDRGFIATIEKRVLDGHGHVDVMLERDGLTVGCEISVTTDEAHEANNLSKCLAAGFDHVVLLCSDERQLANVRALLDPSIGGDVRYLTPERLILFLDELVGAGNRHTSISRQSAVPAPAQATRKLRSAEDTASRLSMKPQTLAKMRWSGDSPPFIKIGRRVFYDDFEVDAWVALRRRRSTSDPGQISQDPRT